MPINVNAKLPAVKILTEEGIFVMTDERALRQDIRPLKIAILNIMPTKIETETQLLRLLSNSPIQVEIVLLHPASHAPKNTSAAHLHAFYKTIEEVKRDRFDGLIITGAPVETLPFTEVDYWDELVDLMNWSRVNAFSTLHICWGAQAGLYHHYGINKYPADGKVFGVFPHRTLVKNHPLLRGFDDVFYAPHSRHTLVKKEDIEKIPELTLLCDSDEAGVYLVCARNGRQIFITGHSEYDPLTLKAEYDRDVSRNLPIHVPANYFPNDNPAAVPEVRWRAHANLLFANWLNHVYQETPFDLQAL